MTTLKEFSNNVVNNEASLLTTYVWKVKEYICECADKRNCKQGSYVLKRIIFDTRNVMFTARSDDVVAVCPFAYRLIFMQSVGVA